MRSSLIYIYSLRSIIKVIKSSDKIGDACSSYKRGDEFIHNFIVET
jgi:hypothetical protein